MKYPIFLLGFIFSFFSGSAQTHDYTNAGCRYFICPTGQHCAIEEGRPGCPACRKDFDDEIKAMSEESKRKADEKAAQELVEKQKRDEEFKKIAEQRKADENNKISIVSPNVEKEKITTPKTNKTGSVTIKLPNYKGKLFPKRIYNPLVKVTSQNLLKNDIGIFGVAFTDAKGDTILKSTEFYVEREYPVDEMSDNVAIVTYNHEAPSQYPNVNFRPMNLVNSKGQKLLKAENINNIEYCKNNLFLIYSGGGFKSDERECGTSISLFDYTNNTLQEVKATINQGVNYINGYGIDTKIFFCINRIVTRNKLTGKPEAEPFKRLPAMKSLLESQDWILIFFKPIATKTIGFPEYEILFVDKNRKVNSLIVFDPSGYY